MEILAGLVGLVTFWFLRLVTQAPLGYEDESGFHCGVQPCETDKG